VSNEERGEPIESRARGLSRPSPRFSPPFHP
jgi:hypothetical protein